jgi:hypothetical protein
MPAATMRLRLAINDAGAALGALALHAHGQLPVNTDGEDGVDQSLTAARRLCTAARAILAQLQTWDDDDGSRSNRPADTLADSAITQPAVFSPAPGFVGRRWGEIGQGAGEGR